MVGQSVDHGAGGEEQEGLEEGVREHVENAVDVVPGPYRQEHVTELGDRRVCQGLFDVVLAAGDRRRQQGGAGADTGDHP